MRSRVDAGTTFQIFLPASTLPEEGARQQCEAAAPDDVELSGDVLVVDNDEAILKTTSILLKALKLCPYTAHDRHEALAVVRRHATQLRAIVLDPACWEESTGLRYPARRPWTGDVDYCTISEMGPVLSALNRMIETDPKDAEALDRATKLVAGLRRLVVEHRERLTPAGAFPVDPPVYSFPSDVVVRGRGFAPELSTGFADATLRACTVIHPLMQHHFLTGSKPALDLAKGLSNLLTGLSHFFSHKTEFQGEVHSALVAAAGLAAVEASADYFSRAHYHAADGHVVCFESLFGKRKGDLHIILVFHG